MKLLDIKVENEKKLQYGLTNNNIFCISSQLLPTARALYKHMNSEMQEFRIIYHAVLHIMYNFCTYSVPKDMDICRSAEFGSLFRIQ